MEKTRSCFMVERVPFSSFQRFCFLEKGESYREIATDHKPHISPCSEKPPRSQLVAVHVIPHYVRVAQSFALKALMKAEEASNKAERKVGTRIKENKTTKGFIRC